MCKINWDMAIDSKNMHMGIDIVARDCEGHIIAAKCRTICVRQEPIVAEAQADLCVEKFCYNLGLQNIILVGDSSQVINAVNAWSKLVQVRTIGGRYTNGSVYSTELAN
jgi:hypothetical protein